MPVPLSFLSRVYEIHCVVLPVCTIRTAVAASVQIKFEYRSHFLLHEYT